MMDAQRYQQHLAEFDRERWQRVCYGDASAADLIAYARWELREAMQSLPPDPHDEPRGRPVDGFHAGCCALRAEAALRQLERLLESGAVVKVGP